MCLAMRNADRGAGENEKKRPETRNNEMKTKGEKGQESGRWQQIEIRLAGGVWI
jgi:hypothetical protein